MSDKQILHKNIAEFITVSAEFCAFINKCEKFLRIDFIDKSIKILTLLYLKASMIDVVEDEHNEIHALVAEKIGSHEAYFDIVDSVGYDSNESVNVSITECYADIYQDIMNFVMLYRDFDDDERVVAVADCIANFKTFWGTRALRLISELHLIKYGDRILENEKFSDVSESDNKSEIW